MAQPTKSGLSVEDLKKSLKSLSSEMNPEQLKRANETLGKLESVSAKPNDDSVEIQKTNIKIEKSLDKTGPINKSLLELQKLYRDAHKENIKNNKLSLAKLDKLATGRQQDIKRVLPIREDDPLTFREGAKATVASVKGAISGIGSGIKSIGGGIKNVFTKPGDVLSKARGGLVSAYESVKDVATTKKDYGIRKDRVSERMVESELGQGDDGSLMDSKDRKRLRKNVAEVSYGKMTGAETKLLDINKKLKQFEATGVPPPKELVKQKEEQEKIHREADIRPKDAPVSKKQKAAPATAEGPSEKANEAAEKSSIETLTKARSENPEADNVTSANEKMADSLKELSQTSKELLTTTKESVDILKAIKADLAGDDVKPLRGKPAEGSGSGAPAAAEAAPTSPSLLDTALDLGGDLLDRGKGKGAGKGFPRGKAPSIPGKGGLGSNIMKGMKGIGGKLGGLGGIAKGAAGVLGKLAVPLAVATAGYDAYKGVERAGENFDLKEGEEASLGQKTSSALGSVASGLSFGIVDEKSASQGIHKAGSAVKDFFGFGDKETSQKFPLKDEGTLDAKSTAVAKPAETASGRKSEDVEKAQLAAKEKYQAAKLEEKLSSKKLKTFEKENPFDYREKPTAEQNFDEMPGTGKFKDPKKQEEYNKLVSARETSSESKRTAAQDYTSAEGVTQTQKFGGKEARSGKPGGLRESMSAEMQSNASKIMALKKRGLTDKDLKRDDSLKKNYIQLGDGSRYPMSTLGLYEEVAQQELDAPVKAKMDSSQVGAMQPAAAEGKLSSDPQMDQDIKAHRKRAAEVTPSRPSASSSDLSTSSLEYTDLDRERSQAKPAPAPLIMNNSSNNSTTKVMPMKAEPRPGDRGSAYERYLERTSAY